MVAVAAACRYGADMSDDTRIDIRGPPEQSWPGFALPRGTEVNGYRFERVLGSGGFGITYLAVDLLQQRFAIKEYFPRQFATRENQTVRPATSEDAAMFEDCRARFEREAKALVTLGRVTGAGEGIVHVQTYFEAFGTCFLVMDYVEGTSLANVLRQEPGGLPAVRVRTLLVQLLSAIRIVHRAGLVHRDIKPANIILRDDDRLMLIDFGATRPADPSESSSYTQIYSGGYGPPEQMLGHRQGEFSDIYAIGAVCYRAIGGHPANALARQNSIAAGHPDPQPTAAAIGAGRYPPDLLAAIDAALAIDPARRPQSADAMLAMLGIVEPAALPATTAPPTGFASRRRPLWIGAAGAAVAAMAGVAFLLLRSPAPAPPTPPTRPLAASPGFQRAVEAAAALPCTALHLVADDGTVRVSGFAPNGHDLDWFLAGLRDLGPLSDEVARIDRSVCPVLAAMAPLVRASWERASPPIAIHLDPASVAPGARVGIALATALPALYVDLYQPDGSVRHLLRPGTARRKTAEWTAQPPAAGRLLVAFGAAAPLDLGNRPDSERSSDYLGALRPRLAGGTGQLAADLAIIQVKPAEPGANRETQPR
jgi:predicted Ser/Thr protein kinase